jgi:hypothetical protein
MKLELLDQLGNTAELALRADIMAFLELRRELLRRAPELATVTSLDLVGVLAAMRLKDLEEILFLARGQNSCARLGTRITQRIERKRGRRAHGRSQDLV